MSHTSLKKLLNVLHQMSHNMAFWQKEQLSVYVKKTRYLFPNIVDGIDKILYALLDRYGTYLTLL